MKRLLFVLVLLLFGTAFAIEPLSPLEFVGGELLQAEYTGNATTSLTVLFINTHTINMDEARAAVDFDRAAAFCCPGSAYAECDGIEFDSELFVCEEGLIESTKKAQGKISAYCSSNTEETCVVGVTELVAVTPSEGTQTDDPITDDPIPLALGGLGLVILAGCLLIVILWVFWPFGQK